MSALFSPELMFNVSNALVLVGWIVLVALPRRLGRFPVPTRYVIPGLLGIAYAVVVIPAFATMSVDFTSLEGIRTLYREADDATLVAGWQHILAFDLFVGTWIAERLDALGVHRLVQIPAYLLTFMLGPVGLLLAFAIETTARLRRRTA